jgi:hypothetical protein
MRKTLSGMATLLLIAERSRLAYVLERQQCGRGCE